MTHRRVKTNEEAEEASWEAVRGSVYGAARWGVGTAILGAIAYACSPVYRGLTLQFKVYDPQFPPNPSIRSGGGECLHARSRCREEEREVDGVYRYLHVSGMVVGGTMEGDRRLRAYETNVRLQRRLRRDDFMRRRHEEEQKGQEDQHDDG